VASDEPFNSPFTSGVDRSSGTGEGYSNEPTQVRVVRQVSDGRASCAKSGVSDFLVRPSSDYQHGDEGILDAGRAVEKRVNQVTLLSSAAKLDSATVATPALPLVETVSHDDPVLAGSGVCATTADTAPVTTHRPVVWDIRVGKSNVPDAPPELDFRKDFALSSFSRVH
jgi:hypothetical protein